MISCVNTINILAGNPNPARLNNLFLQLSSLWFLQLSLVGFFTVVVKFLFLQLSLTFFTVVVKIIIIFVQLSSFLQLSLFFTVVVAKHDNDLAPLG